MAGCLSSAGVELRIYGDTQETQPIAHDHLVANVMTGRKNKIPGEETLDDECAEICELYLAADEPNLFRLLTTFPPVKDTSVCINTSAASRNVPEPFSTATGLGTMPGIFAWL